MRISLKSWLTRVTAALVAVCVVSAFALAANKPHYVITNDDVPPALITSVTFYTVAADGLLTMKAKVLAGKGGIAGGYFAANRVNVLNSGNQECAYVSVAQSGEIDGISIKTLEVGGHAVGSLNDTGASNGIGLAMNAQYLFASFTDSNTIGTFQLLPGCSLSFVNDISVAGLQGGIINAMALHGNILIATYGDGSIESFNISAGTPASNGDEQNSTAYLKSRGATYPNSVEITKNGRFALFGDTATSTVVEVSEIFSGKLSRTAVFSLGPSINSSNILLSPDETLLYISNTEGDKISAAFFNPTTGKLTLGCASNRLKGFSSSWSYLAALGLGTNTGTGGIIYVAEFGAPSSIGMVHITSTGAKCSMKEVTGSPVADPNSPGLLSIGSFPPRSF